MKLEGKPPRRKDGSCMAEWAEWHSSGRERDTRDKQKKTGPMTKWQGRVTGPESPPRTRRCALHRFPHWTLTPHPKAENPNPPASQGEGAQDQAAVPGHGPRLLAGRLRKACSPAFSFPASFSPRGRSSHQRLPRRGPHMAPHLGHSSPFHGKTRTCRKSRHKGRQGLRSGTGRVSSYAQRQNKMKGISIPKIPSLHTQGQFPAGAKGGEGPPSSVLLLSDFPAAFQVSPSLHQKLPCSRRFVERTGIPPRPLLSL